MATQSRPACMPTGMAISVQWTFVNSMSLRHGARVVLALLLATLTSPVQADFEATGSLATARRLHVSVPLPSGKVLVAGGYSTTGSDINSAELYDPATGTWSAAGTFNPARFWHAASALASGHALVVGGMTNQGQVLNSVQRYDPFANTWGAAAALTIARLTRRAKDSVRKIKAPAAGHPAAGAFFIRQVF